MQIFEEGEDEPTPGISLVSKNTEMPEGVEFSDGDGKDSDENNDDPHKALGEINLDDLEFHENNKESHRTLISNDSSIPTELFGASSSLTKKKKKEKKEKKEKKKKKSSKDENEDISTKKVTKTANILTNGANNDEVDMDFWLSESNQVSFDDKIF